MAAPWPAKLIWLLLTISTVASLVLQRWPAAGVSFVTLCLTFVPILAAERYGIKIPQGFAVAIILFLYATLFLGEVKDFYERFWWWDVFLHGGSAMAFGLTGFLLLFMLFEGDRFAAPAGAIASLGFCFAVTVGAIWEIFEFAMDQIFGLNMQKSGLVDTMWDLIVDCLGAAVGASWGYLYLKRNDPDSMVGGWIEAFINKNRGRFYRKFRARAKNPEA